MGFEDLISVKYKIVLKGKSLGLIKWNGKQWDLSGLPNSVRKKLETTKVTLLFTKKPVKDILITHVTPLTLKDPLWAFQLIKVLTIKNSPIQLVPVSESLRGGPGSGFFGHLGRPGLRGGSRHFIWLSKHLQEDQEKFGPQIRKARAFLKSALGGVPKLLYEKCPIKKLTLATDRDFFEREIKLFGESKSYKRALYKAYQTGLKTGQTKAKTIQEFEKEEFQLFMKHSRIMGLTDKNTHEIMINIAAPDLDHTVLHEYGHLVDLKYGFSDSSEWKKAVKMVHINEIKDKVRAEYGKFDNFILEDVLARAELFADSFAFYFKSLRTRLFLEKHYSELSRFIASIPRLP